MLKSMKMIVKAGIASVAVFTGSGLIVGPVQAAGWTCSAANLKNYSYSGGSKAMIHLRSYSKGGRYSVRKVNAKKVTGTTKDGTKFACVKK